MSDIKPRYDDDGVPWCDADCPKYWRGGRRIPSSCEIDQFARSPRDVCPHAVKEMTGQLHRLIRYRNGEERGSDVIEFLDKLIEEDTKRRDTEIATLRRQLDEAREDKARVIEDAYKDGWTDGFCGGIVPGAGNDGFPTCIREEHWLESDARAAIDATREDDDERSRD